MKDLHCLLGFHDFYAIYQPLILQGKEDQKFQYMTMKRICVHCKHREEYIIQLAEKLQDWDVALSAPNFVSEERYKKDTGSPSQV